MRWFLRNLTFQVLLAIALGIALGTLSPQTAVSMKILGDTFVQLIKILIGPIIFVTIVTGIYSVGDLKRVGRLGGKAIIYFEMVTTLALVVGLAVANLIRPGDGIATKVDSTFDIHKYEQSAGNLMAAFARGNLLLHVLVFAI